MRFVILTVADTAPDNFPQDKELQAIIDQHFSFELSKSTEELLKELQSSSFNWANSPAEEQESEDESSSLVEWRLLNRIGHINKNGQGTNNFLSLEYVIHQYYVHHKQHFQTDHQDPNEDLCVIFSKPF